jgi:hypothetical protein
MLPEEFKEYVDLRARLDIGGNDGADIEDYNVFDQKMQEKYGMALLQCVKDAVGKKNYVACQEINSFRDDYYFLSNFSPSFIEYDGNYYHTVEHAYQAQKTLDPEARWRFCIAGDIGTSSRAKAVGGAVLLRPDWEAVRLGIMEDLLRIKFQDAKLRVKLIATRQAKLTEGNYWNDVFWGVCKGVGENHLGKLLMKIRKEIMTYA